MKESIKQNGIIKTLPCLFLFLTLLFISGCDKTPHEPEVEPELLVYCQSISLVKGGTQTVIVSSHDKYGGSDGFTVTCKDASVASVVIFDTTFSVIGMNYGSTSITITSLSGKSAGIPVRIYDPQILDTEELLIAFSQTFQFRWNDNGSGQSMNGSYWHPLTTDGFKALGSLGFQGHYNPTGKHGVIVLKAKSGSEALAAPVDYTLLFSDQGSHAKDSGSFWIPVPPAGYKAMGIVTQSGYNKPDLEDVVCVREDLTIPGEVGELLWKCAYLDNPWLKIFSSWKIEPPAAGPHENAYLAPGTFVAVSSTFDPPSVHSVMNVLNVPLPMLADTPYQDYFPGLKGFNQPQDETVPILVREMLVPCTILSDQAYKNDIMWRITNSPFYWFERQVFYKLLYYKYNQTSVQQHESYTRKIGVTTLESDEFWSETSISVSVEGGISIRMLEEKVSATVSTSFGYSSMTSVSELQHEENETGADVPPGKAVAVWQRWNRFVLKRHNGISMERVKAWEFGINSFVTDEYPD